MLNYSHPGYYAIKLKNFSFLLKAKEPVQNIKKGNGSFLLNFKSHREKINSSNLSFLRNSKRADKITCDK